jgi:hypothetical protein
MPNHIRNRLIASPATIDALWDAEKSEIDFGRLIPVPEIIAKHENTPSHIKSLAEIALGLIDFRMAQRPAGTYASDGIGAMSSALHASNCTRQLLEGPHAKDLKPEDFEMFVDFMRAYRECGHCDWYDWNCANWGTKWNAYDCNRIAQSLVEFDTAWSHPRPVIDALAARFIGDHIIHSWSDEDTGSNCGQREYAHGTVMSERIPESGSREAYELAFDMRPSLRDEYIFDDAKGTYAYVDEEATA